MKRVGVYAYVHKSNIGELLDYIKDDRCRDIITAKEYIEHKGFKYEIIKYDRAKHWISFIDSPDWITANEPEVGNGWLCKIDEDWEWKFIPRRKNNPQIYHSKYKFVDASFYKEFDVIESYFREQQWQKLPGIKEVKCKIGNKNFWIEFLKQNGMEE